MSVSAYFAPRIFERAALACALASAVAAMVSIAAAQILLAAACAALLASPLPLRLPRVWLPLALFLAWTILSMIFSGDFSSGRPQLRKIFVYLTLLAVYATFRHLADVRRLALWWCAAGAVTGGWGLVQFYLKILGARAEHSAFYDYYVGARIRGPMGHWMTFSGELMIALLMALALLFFARRRLRGWVLALVCGSAFLMGAALVLGLTRSMWLGAGAGVLYLVANWRPKLLLAVPVLLAAGFFAAPDSVRARAVSVFRPRGDKDSNQHRVVCWRVGWRIVQAHPLLGLGPEIVKRDFDQWVPADIPRPLPEGWYGHLHSIYIHYAAERGVPAAVFLVWAFGQSLWLFWRRARRLPRGDDARFALHGAAAVIVALLVAGVFELNLGDSEVLEMALAALACGYLALDRHGEYDREHAHTP